MSRRRRCRADRGAATSLELVLVTPVVLALLCFVVFCGRSGRAAHAVHELAATAARAASLERSQAAAQEAAGAAVVGASDGDLTCGAPTVSFASDGTISTVTVQVRCEASLRGLALLPLGGAKAFTARATEVLDRYREAA